MSSFMDAFETLGLNKKGNVETLKFKNIPRAALAQFNLFELFSFINETFRIEVLKYVKV